jgi:soluble epoxide hydrolase / lipid-phosphate phosphatase
MKDEALPPAMCQGMRQYLPQLTWKTVQASHWALWETADEVSGYIVEWLRAMDKHRHSVL